MSDRFANRVWVPEEQRPYLDDMRPKDIWEELLFDAVSFHATNPGRFVIGISIMSKKWKKHADTLLLDLDREAKAINGIGLPMQPSMRKVY